MHQTKEYRRTFPVPDGAKEIEIVIPAPIDWLSIATQCKRDAEREEYEIKKYGRSLKNEY